MSKSNLLIYSIVDLNSIFHFKESLSISGLGLVLLAHMENSNSESISTISSVESVSIVINPENITNDELLEEPSEENVEDEEATQVSPNPNAMKVSKSKRKRKKKSL